MTDETAILAMKALDALSLRATAIAQNIANATSPGYRAVRVNFEAELRAAAARGDSNLASWQPRVELAPYRLGEDAVRVDLELAEASSTAGRYAALVDLVGRQLAMTSLAITGEG